MTRESPSHGAGDAAIGLLFLLVLMAAPAAFIVLIIFVARRMSTRYCPQCKLPMRRLTEEQDDAYLAFDQKFEEDLGSVDYRVWRCDTCQTCHVEGAKRWISNYEDCPRCGHRTVRVESYTLREPTYYSAGERAVTKTCQYPRCGYHDTHRTTIPRLQQASSSFPSGGSGWGSSTGGSWSSGGHSSGGGGFSGGGSFGGGSFGGGSSGGGGAGRSW